MRKLNQFDRLLDAYGFGEEFMDRCLSTITDTNDPGYICAIGEGRSDLVDNIQRVNPDLKSENWLATLPPVEQGGADIPFSLANEAFTNHLVRIVKGGVKTDFKGRIKLVILFHQVGKEQWLLHFLNECKGTDVTVIRVIGNRANGRLGLSQFPGWESIPDSVDVTVQTEMEEEELGGIPDAAMYGRLQEIAEQTQAPMGFAYVAGLAAASVFLQSNNCNIRATVYAGEIGDVGEGKSVAIDRTRSLLGLPDTSSYVIRTPYSDRGLARVCPGTEYKKRLLAVDEGRVMMAKGNIENSSLISLLCSLWSRNVEGGADRHGLEELNVELSILMAIKAASPAEFSEVFTHSTAHGFWDRCVYGVLGDEKWEFREWDFEPERDTIKLQFSQPMVPLEIYELAREWQADKVERKRLREIALRTAYITSSASNQAALSRDSLDAALAFCEWQEAIRKEYRPAQGADDYQVCYNAVEAAFKKAGGHANWHQLSRKGNWSKYHGRVLRTVKKNLESDGTIIYIRQTGEHVWNGGQHE